VEGELPADAGAVDIERAAIRRVGTDATLITYGGTLRTALTAADELAAAGIEAEVIDLRVLRPLDEVAVVESVSRTHRAVVVDEGWRSGSLAAEVSARIMEQAFYELDAPVARVDFLNVVVVVHEQAGIEIPERDYPKLATLDDAVAYLLAAQQRGAGA